VLPNTDKTLSRKRKRDMNNQNNVPGQKHASRVSRLAIASCCLALLPWIWILFGLPDLGSLTVDRLLTLVPWPLSVVIGISALVLITYRRPKLRGKALAIVGIAISIASITFYFVAVRNLNRLIYQPMNEIRACQSNMSELHASLEDYAENHDGLLPAGPNWCDELLQENNELAAMFVCRNSVAKPGQSSYALNKNVAGQKLSDLARDTVLLFETTAGWNQVGGPELITTDNHSLITGDHCNVIFARGGTQHVPSDKIHELLWETEIPKTP
jgi:hypothetical protein